MAIRHSILALSVLAALTGCNDNADFLNPGASSSANSESTNEPSSDEQSSQDGSDSSGTDEPAWVNSMYLNCSWQAIESETSVSFGCAVASTDKALNMKDLISEAGWKILGSDNAVISEGIGKTLENLFTLPRQSFAGIRAELTLQLKSGAALTRQLAVDLNGMNAEGGLASCLGSETSLATCFEQAGITIESKSTESKEQPAAPLDPAGTLRVTGVSVKGTSWLAEAVAIGTGSGAAQLRTVPLTGINQIIVTLSKFAFISQDKFKVQGVRIKDYEISSYTIGDNIVTLTLGQVISDDKIRLQISSGSSNIDGEWTNPATYAATGSSEFPSGDGKDGGQFEFRFNALRGDASNATEVNNGTISPIDSLVIINSINAGAYTRQYDIDSNGVVEQADAQFVTDRLNNGTNLVLPAGEP